MESSQLLEMDWLKLLLGEQWSPSGIITGLSRVTRALSYKQSINQANHCAVRIVSTKAASTMVSFTISSTLSHWLLELLTGLDWLTPMLMHWSRPYWSTRNQLIVKRSSRSLGRKQTFAQRRLHTWKNNNYYLENYGGGWRYKNCVENILWFIQLM